MFYQHYIYLYIQTSVIRLLLFVINSAKCIESVILKFDPRISINEYRINHGKANRIYAKIHDIGEKITAGISDVVFGTICCFAAKIYNADCPDKDLLLNKALATIEIEDISAGDTHIAIR